MAATKNSDLLIVGTGSTGPLALGLDGNDTIIGASTTDFIHLVGNAPYTISDEGSFSVLTLGSVSITFADTILTAGDFL